MWPFQKQISPDYFSTYTENMTLVRETRWWREYRNADSGMRFQDSRFRDGSASIKLAELTRAWPEWSDDEKVDFSQSFVYYQGRHRAKILRFLVRNGDHPVWSAIAVPVATTLSFKESMPFLRECCETCEFGRGANYFQAIWIMQSPEGIPILWKSLDRIWDSPDLMISGCNFSTLDAIWCINALVRLGEPLESLRERYETLKTHPTMRQDVIARLSEHFEQ